MLRRILSVAAGVVLGSLLLGLTTRTGVFGRLFGDRELENSAAYVRAVMELVNENYVDGNAVQYPELTDAALRGLVQELDPHSEFLTADSFQAMEEEIDGNFGGIGVQVEQRNGRVVVVAPIAGSPGERAGILRGDEIVGVDGEDLERGTPLSEVVARLRGTPDSEVQVELYRPNSDETLEIAIVREVIRVQSVRNISLLGDGIGYLQVTEFSRSTGEEVRGAIDQLQALGMTSLVLDLRNNPGGLLSSAVDVAGQFFRDGELVLYTEGRRAEARTEYRAAAKADGPLQFPVVVLINAGSASASEVVAGALKDTNRAVIVGERSFGKGSVQSIFPLPNGEGLRLTTARYFTPSGVSIHEVGVTPHVEVIMTPEEDAILSRQWARSDITDSEEFRDRFRVDPVLDRQLEAAQDILRGIRAFEARRSGYAPL